MEANRDKVEDVLSARFLAIREEMAELEAAFDEKMVTDSNYYIQKVKLEARMDEAKEVTGQLRKYGLMPPDGEQLVEIGQNGTLRLFRSKDNHLVLYTDGVRSLDIDNPTIREVEDYKSLLGMNE